MSEAHPVARARAAAGKVARSPPRKRVCGCSVMRCMNDSRPVRKLCRSSRRTHSGLVLLVVLHGRIADFGSAAIYAASWITFLHVCLGEFILVRYLDARSTVQNALDLLAAVFLAAGIVCFMSPALWCAFFGAVFAMAVTKYLLVGRDTDRAEVRRYVREKVFLETPAVVGLAALAVVIDRLPPRSAATYLLQLAILIATTAFAVWMVAVRQRLPACDASRGGQDEIHSGTGASCDAVDW